MLLHTVVLPPRSSFQAVHEDSALADEVPILHLDSTDEHTYPGKHAEWTSYWHRRITCILVVQGQLNATRRWFPNSLINEAEANHAAIWTKGI